MTIFHKGDHVKIADDLGPMMAHFTAGVEAIVVGSYSEQYGNGTTKEEDTYTLLLKDQGETSWYHARQLTLIAHNQRALEKQWRDERDAIKAVHGDMDWIFSQGQALLNECSGETVRVLGIKLGCDNLWGKQGEGYVWHVNARSVLALASRFIVARDKEGFLRFAASFKALLHGGTGPFIP